MNPVAKSRTYKMMLVALFAALIAVGAFIRVPVPLVPFTMQTFFVVLAGMLLGKKLGGASALVYLAIGLIGIPVFTQGGGIGYVLKPSFGYLIGSWGSRLVTHQEPFNLDRLLHRDGGKVVQGEGGAPKKPLVFNDVSQ